MEAQKLLNIFLHSFRRSIQSDVKWSKIGVSWRIWLLRDGLNSYKSVAKISGIMDLPLLQDQNRILEAFEKKNTVTKTL